MRARPELPLVKHTPNCCQQIQIVLERIALYLLPGCLADSASRCVDDAQQAGRVLERKRSEEHTSELQSQSNLVCRLLLEKKKKKREQNRDANQKLTWIKNIEYKGLT